MFELKPKKDLTIPESCQRLVEFSVHSRNPKAREVARLILHLRQDSLDDSEYRFQIRELCCLGTDYLGDALELIKIFTFYGITPDEFYENSHELIDHLIETWKPKITGPKPTKPE